MGGVFHRHTGFRVEIICQIKNCKIHTQVFLTLNFWCNILVVSYIKLMGIFVQLLELFKIGAEPPLR